jgi:phosphate transport system protein
LDDPDSVKIAKGKPAMTRQTLDRRIRYLLDEILVMDSMVEQATLAAVAALKDGDVEAARRVYAGDAQINASRFKLENETMVVLATQQPIMAHDLRLLASILEVTGELERIGDYAKGIAKIALIVGEQPPVKPLVDIPQMSEIAVDMLHRAVSAFVRGDADAARQIPALDDLVDRLYNTVYRDLAEIVIRDPSTIDRANYLLYVAHNLERLADRVTNICERTIYLATGVMKELEQTDDETVLRLP